MPLAPEQIKGIVSDMTDAGFSEEEIDQTLAGVREIGAMQQSGSKEEQYKQLGLGAVAGMGAFALPGIAPEAGMFLRNLLAGIGGGTAQEAARPAITGERPDPVRGLQTAAITGGGGLVLEGLIGGAGRLGAWGSGIPKETYSAVRRIPTFAIEPEPRPGPFQGRVTSPSAQIAYASRKTLGEFPQQEAGQRVLDALNSATKDMSPGRLANQDLIDSLDKNGARIGIKDTLDSLNKAIPAKPTGSAQKSVATAIENMRDDIIQNYLGGGQGRAIRMDVGPKDMDAISQALSDEAYRYSGDPKETKAASALRQVLHDHRNSFYNQVGGMREAAANTHDYLDAIQYLERYVSEKTPEGFARQIGEGTTQDDVQAQSALKALRTFQNQTGIDLESQLQRLGMQQRFRGGQQGGRLGRMEYVAERAFSRPVAKFGAVAAKPAGRMGAATAAFLSGMQSGTKPEENP